MDFLFDDLDSWRNVHYWTCGVGLRWILETKKLRLITQGVPQERDGPLHGERASGGGADGAHQDS